MSSSPRTLKKLFDDVRLKFIVVPSICTPAHTRIPPLTAKRQKQLKGLTVASAGKPCTAIDLLIATDSYYSVHLNDDFVELECGMVGVKKSAE